MAEFKECALKRVKEGKRKRKTEEEKGVKIGMKNFLVYRFGI